MTVHSIYRKTAVGLAVVALAATGCSTKSSNDATGTSGDDASTGTSSGPVERCVNGSKERRLSNVSPKKSSRIGAAAPEG